MNEQQKADIWNRVYAEMIGQYWRQDSSDGLRSISASHFIYAASAADQAVAYAEQHFQKKAKG